MEYGDGRRRKEVVLCSQKAQITVEALSSQARHTTTQARHTTTPASVAPPPRAGNGCQFQPCGPKTNTVQRSGSVAPLAFAALLVMSAAAVLAVPAAVASAHHPDHSEPLPDDTGSTLKTATDIPDTAGRIVGSPAPGPPPQHTGGPRWAASAAHPCHAGCVSRLHSMESDQLSPQQATPTPISGILESLRTNR